MRPDRKKIHRFFGDFDITQTSLVIDDRDTVHQIHTVLRLKPGEHIALFDGSGYEAEYEIAAIDKKTLALSRIEYKKNDAEPTHPTALFLAILKKENFELAVQKAVETGVTEIVPVITERTVKTGLDEARLMRIIKEATEQSGRGTVPALHTPLPFADTLTYASSLGTNSILFDASGSPFSPSTYPLEPRTFFIGPEGGFTTGEVSAARDAGIAIASLGPRILRAETAAIVATYLLAQ